MATALSPPPALDSSWHYSNNATPSSSSSSTSLSSSLTPTHPAKPRHSPPPSAYPPSARKIRFAPLPDPRRAVLVTDDGEELPIPNGEDATTITSCPPSPAVYAVDAPTQDISSLISFNSSSKRNSDSTDPSSTSGSTTPASLTNTTNSEASGSEPASPASTPVCLPTLPSAKTPTASNTNGSGFPKSKGLSFFRSFKRRSGSSSSSSSSYSLTPTNSIDPTPSTARKGITTEEILTLGTINLFRASSRETGDGWNLTRWASAGPASTGSGGPARNFGVPLTRTQSTQSTQSYKSKTPSLLSGLRPSTAPTPKSAKQAIPNRKGTRMLNGRVYGSKRDPNANPFANARDDEPEFVEWGYGGMGSVKGAKSAGVAGAGWEKLGGAPDDDLEDSTGTAWVRKRREARAKKEQEEREAKEKAEREAQEALEKREEEKTSSEANPSGEVPEARPELHSNVSAAPTVTTITESAQPTPTASSADITASRLAPKPSMNSWKEALSHPSTPTIPPATPSREIGSPTSAAAAQEDDHVFTTLAIPMTRPHHHRTRSASNATSTHAFDSDAKVVPSDLVKVESESETESETSSDSDSEKDDDEEDEDEEDDEEEEEEQRRKMVIGAGMEKISRHRDEHRDEK